MLKWKLRKEGIKISGVILFKELKKAKLAKEHVDPIKKSIRAEIYLMTDMLKIIPKEKHSPMMIPFHSIKLLYSKRPKKSQFNIILHLQDGEKIAIYFKWGGHSIPEMGEEFYRLLNAQMEKIKEKEKLNTVLKGIQEIKETNTVNTNIFHIHIPPRTRLTALKCPNCQAPLELMPPCNCEHCGVLIELI